MDFKKSSRGITRLSLFQKKPISNNTDSLFKKVSLYDALNNSYNPQDKLGDYSLDKDLSNHNQQVYHRAGDNKLLVSYTGSHNLSDIGTDLALALGKLKDTSRFKEGQDVLQRAKQKYNTDATIIGHSLGGTIGQYAGDSGDKVVSYNKGTTFGQPTRDNEAAYRSGGDFVSYLGSGIHRIETPFYSPITNHGLDNIKDENIFV